MQARESFFALALVMTLSAFGATGCDKEYPCATSTNASDVNFSGITPHPNDHDGGAAQPDDAFTGFGEASLYLASEEEENSGERCLQIGTFGATKSGASVSVNIELDCAPGVGTFDLEALNATACVSESTTFASDDVERCGAISGTLTVSAYAASCGIGGGCAHLHAEMVVAPGADGALTLNGTAHLAYDESMIECHEPVVTFPGGD